MADEFGGVPVESPAADEFGGVPVGAPAASPQSLLSKAVEPITSLPSEYQRQVQESIGTMKRGAGQIMTGEPWEMTKGAGNIALGTLGYVGAPISAPLHTIVGKPVAEATGSPIAGTIAEVGAGFALPVPKGIPRFAKTAKPPPIDEFGVTLSAGERTGDLAMRHKEQQAIRLGEPAGQEWIQQRGAQLEQAREGITGGFDPFGQQIARTPTEAGQIVSQSVQTAAQQAKAGVKQAYTEAKALPGEIHAGAFEGIAPKIKWDLSQREEPIIVDELTPRASKALDYLQNQIANLQIKNKAAPFGQPSAEAIVGVNLKGVEQWRKNLSAMRRDAYSSGNAPDGRAMSAVVDAFDSHIDRAIQEGLFSGDPAAIRAWNNARAAHADYRATFGGQSKDPAGRVVQKILGDNINDPLTPTKVIDQIVGSSGVSPSALNIAVAGRVKKILGDQSPEWIAVKQGLFRRLAETGEGEATLGTGQVAQRMSKFLNGDLASTIYSPRELSTLRSYANLMRQITMPPGSYFPSAPPMVKAMSAVANRVGAIIGALVGRSAVPGMPLVGELAGLTVGSKIEKAIEKTHFDVSSQLPIISREMQKWNKAQSRLAAAKTDNPLLRRAAVGATVGLQKALTPLGIDLTALLQSPAVTRAGDEQQEIPRPPAQQNNGGKVEDKQKFAHGGAVRNLEAEAENATHIQQNNANDLIAEVENVH